MPNPGANQKAFIETEKGDRLPCLFNPAELQVTRSNEWSGTPRPGLSVPLLRYAGAKSGSLRLNLFFDTTTEGEPVTKYTSKLFSLMEPEADLPGTTGDGVDRRPQTVHFHWGDFHSFQAVITSLDVTFVYFSASGVPLRARADLVLTQYREDDAFALQNPTSHTPHPHRVHRVAPGETLDRIAAAHYGDATRWRAIAAANGVEDPLAIRPGTLLAIPKLDRT